MINVSISHLFKIYGKKIALQDINAQIKSGSFFCILGEPGAGKTTLLRIIAGLEIPENGNIFFDGKEMTLVPAPKRDIAMVFQDFALYPHMTVFENIASPLRAIRLDERIIKERVQKVTSFLKIDYLLDRSPLNISGGEKQRVAIARSLVKEPKISLFDEPLVNLDFKIREDMRAQFKLMQREFQQTIVFATPDPVDAMSMADEVLILHEGKVQQLATVWEAYYRPKNLFVATYLGFPLMNILEGKISQNQSKLLWNSSDSQIDLTGFPGIQEVKGEKMFIGIRPEHIILEKVDESHVSWEGIVSLSEVIGSDTIVHLKMGSQTNLRAFMPGIYRVTIGEKVKIGFQKNDLYIFNESGECIYFPKRNESPLKTH